MKKYLVLYHAPASAMEQMAATTPEQAKAGMEAWMAWFKKAGSAVVDPGAPLGGARRVPAGAGSGGAGTARGYSVLQADTIDAVLGVLRDHPHLRMPNGSIEVFESLPLPGGM
jgi:hypothetical protein